MASESAEFVSALSFLIAKGGWVVEVLLLISVVGWGIVLEKLCVLVWGVLKKGESRGKILRAHLFLLNLLSEVSPMLGLLGTVRGLIRAFRAISESGRYPPVSQLAGGMWEALLTTFVGLAVAIPLYFFYVLLDEIGRRWDSENYADG